MSLADNSADSAFAADQNGLDVAAVLVRYHERCKTGSARKVDGVDIVAGIIEQAAGGALFVCKMWLKQRKIAGVQPPQQIVVGPPGVVWSVSPRNHPVGAPCPAITTIADHIRFL